MARVTLKTLKKKKGGGKKAKYSKPRTTTLLATLPRYGRGASALRAASRLYRNPFPHVRYVKHKYVDRVTLPAQTTAGAPTWYIMRANSTYDPDYTGTGHQPMFRDEMAAKYTNYVVLSSQCKFVIPAQDTTARCFGIILEDDPAIGGGADDFNSVLEYNSHTGPIKLDKRNSSLTLKKTFVAAKEFKSTKKALMADDQQRVGSSANPGTGTARYFKLFCFPQNGSATLSSCDLYVSVTYYVAWLNPDNDPTTS